MKRTVDLEICGQSYRIASQYSENYTQRIAKHLNDKIASIQKNAKTSATEKVLILVLLDVIDELFQLNDKKQVEFQSLEEEVGKLIDKVGSTIKEIKSSS